VWSEKVGRRASGTVSCGCSFLVGCCNVGILSEDVGCSGEVCEASGAIRG